MFISVPRMMKVLKKLILPSFKNLTPEPCATGALSFRPLL